MLDKDVAEVYGISTTRLNQAASRNPERFPEEFRFQLSADDVENLISQIVISSMRSQSVTASKRNKRYLPWAYTREGCNMLSTVLNTPLAIQRSIQIMRAFSAIEREVETGVSFGRFSSLLKEFAEDVRSLKQDVTQLKQRPPVNINLPDDEALPIAIERKIRGRSLSKIARNKEARELAVSLLSDGLMYEEVRDELNKNITGFTTSRSAVGRFWQLWRMGYLKHN